MSSNIISKSFQGSQNSENPIARELRIESDGKGFITFRGMARICGVDHTSLTRVKSWGLFSEKLAEKLTAQGFEVVTFGDWKKTGIPDTAAPIIIEYYAFDAGERCTKEALAAFRSFAAIGLRAWIQQQLGWQPPSIGRQFADKHILREARKWEVMFDHDWIKAAEACTKRKWSEPCMSQVINLLVYDRFPPEVRQALDEYNPATDSGFRRRKQHQFFSEESIECVLREQIEKARQLLLISQSWQELKENNRRLYEGIYQLRLPVN